jgi:hypothetical protein
MRCYCCHGTGKADQGVFGLPFPCHDCGGSGIISCADGGVGFAGEVTNCGGAAPPGSDQTAPG